jgi:hypothetical protein
VVLRDCGVGSTGFAKWKGCVAGAARAFGAVGGSVPVYLKFAAGAGDYSLDATADVSLASCAMACALV